jgi:translocation and assembly module TamA
MRLGRVVLLVLLFASTLSGCALLKPDPEAEAGPPPPPAVRVEVEAPGELKTLLETHLDIARLPVLAPGEPVPDTELARLAAAAPAQARALLETEGYFESEVVAEREEGQPPVVRLRVQPGPRVRVADVRIDVQGPLAQATERRDPQAFAAQRALRHGWGLPPGSFYRNGAWSSAKAASLAQLRAEGYARAAWASTQARVDVPSRTVELAVKADSGPLFRVGELQVEGLRYHDAETVHNLAGFAPGAPATEKLLLDFQERLQTAGLFDRASVLLDDAAPDPSRADVRVRLDESPLQQATVGLGVSANVGPRASVEHTHRRAFGRAAISRALVEAAKLRQAFEGELSSHPQPRFYRNLVGATLERVTSETDTVTSLRTRVGRTQNKPDVDRLAFIELERAIVRRLTDREQADAVTLNYHGVWRRLDDNLLPTDGHALSLQGGLGHARATGAPSGPFLRAYARLTAYRPLWGPWHGEGRIELGQVFKRDEVIVPDTQRFRAGGDESVRGYEYRTLAPVVNGVVESGNVLFTASAEIARPILARLPSVWGALFVDVGHAADRWDDLDPAFGWGVGVRWRSPIGPLKIDLARGHETGKVRLHFTVGVTF